MGKVSGAFSIPTWCLSVAALCLLSSGELHATHKAWLLKNSGMQCVLQNPTGDDAYPGIIENTEPFGVYVSCSVTLAARGGSSNNGNPAPTWLRAKQARIFVEDVRSPFWCRARAEDAFGNVYYGAGKWSPGHGFQIIDLIDDERDWGGSLELEEDGFFRQLDFECRLGSRSASAPAKLFGYDIAICQNRSTDRCTTVRVDRRRGRSTVQGNGIECSASTADGSRQLRRSAFGSTNEGAEAYSVHCPITQPADDSYEHNPQIHSLKVAYTGRTPGCRIESFDERGDLHTSPPLERDTFRRNTLRLPAGAFDVGTEKSLALRCDLPPRSTIEGYVSEVSVTRKSGGI